MRIITMLFVITILSIGNAQADSVNAQQWLQQERDKFDYRKDQIKRRITSLDAVLDRLAPGSEPVGRALDDSVLDMERINLIAK